MLAINDLHVSFHGTTILNGISCTIRQGETVGIIGPNGCGKTTLFNAISGFVDSDSGTISLRDERIEQLSPHERAQRGIGRVFQNFGIFRDMTVLENVLVALESRGDRSSSFFPWSKGSRDNRVLALDYLSQIGLDGKARAKASSLSGGQMRLLEIIRTLAVGSELFLLDEPTAGVSPRMKDDVVGIIKKLQGLGKTVLIIEHDITFIQKFCGRIIVLNEGHIELDNTPDKVRADEKLKDIYFGRDD